MLARKGIFAKPSILQFARQRDRAMPKTCKARLTVDIIPQIPAENNPPGFYPNLLFVILKQALNNFDNFDNWNDRKRQSHCDEIFCGGDMFESECS